MPMGDAFRGLVVVIIVVAVAFVWSWIKDREDD